MGNKNVKIIIIIKIFKLGVKLAYQIIFCRERPDINTQLCKKQLLTREERLKCR